MPGIGRLVSINVGLPREVTFRGKVTRTSIWKAPVEGRVRVIGHNLEGDRQSDLSVHGGPDKAVYVYPSEHYAFWQQQSPDREFAWGNFGENFTSEGLLEDQVRVGDRLRAGTAEFVVTQPRLPCFKLGIRFGRPTMEKRFLQSRRTGFYLGVVSEGEVGAGDAIEWVPNPGDSFSILELVDLYTSQPAEEALLRRALAIPDLSSAWKNHFRWRLRQNEA
jgi:MOSC domain-containing protein YiiM